MSTTTTTYPSVPSVSLDERAVKILLDELENLAQISREADEVANNARAERDAMIAWVLNDRLITGDQVAHACGLTQPRCVQIRKAFSRHTAKVA